MHSFRQDVFARGFIRLNGGRPRGDIVGFRRSLLAHAVGRTLEIGAGHGLNFPHYTESVDEVVAIEPQARLRKLAISAAEDSCGSIRVVSGTAEKLPFSRDAFDCIVVSSVLCRVLDPEGVLAEVRRVLKPNGKLLVWEHVAAADAPLRTAQQLVSRLWRFGSAGCHINRDTAQSITDAGFTFVEIQRFRLDLPWWLEPTSPRIHGVAVSNPT